jgi:putative peptide maturation system protein
MELVWEEQAYDSSVHYDVILRPRGGATVSLSFFPDRALPWPLRGVHRWSDRDLVSVNGKVLTVPQAMACLDFIWRDTSIVDGLIDVCLIRDEVAREPIEVTDEELQHGMDAFRRTRQLFGARDTEAWMQRRGLTQAQLEDLVVDELTVVKLRERVTTSRVESYFEVYRAAFDAAHVAGIEYDDEESARRVSRRLLAGEVEFFHAAQARFLELEFAAEQTGRVLFQTIRRGTATDDPRAAVFAAAPGDFVGPVPVTDGYVVYRVLTIVPARLDEETREVIREVLFKEWLAEKRRVATIEWNWGTATQTRRTRTSTSAGLPSSSES